MKKYGPYDIEKEEEFDIEFESWTKLKLRDGTVLELKPMVSRILKTTAKNELTGEPIYIILSSNVTRVYLPEDISDGQ